MVYDQPAPVAIPVDEAEPCDAIAPLGSDPSTYPFVYPGPRRRRPRSVSQEPFERTQRVLGRVLGLGHGLALLGRPAVSDGRLVVVGGRSYADSGPPNPPASSTR